MTYITYYLIGYLHSNKSFALGLLPQDNTKSSRVNTKSVTINSVISLWHAYIC